MSDLHITFAANDRMALPLGVTMSGALRHLREDCSATLHVLTTGLSATNRRKLARVVEKSGAPGREHRLLFHFLAQGTFGHLPDLRHLSRETYVRLLAPEVLADVDRTVYLDADLLVFRDVSELSTLDLGDAAAGGVVVHDVRTLGESQALAYCYEDEGLDPTLPYFNAGVMVLPLDLWRAEGVTERAMAFLERQADRLLHADQDAINAVLAGRIKPLDPEWNVMGYTAAGIQRIADPDLADRCWTVIQSPEDHACIVHFTGRFKPWSNRSLRHTHRGRYFRELDKSGWFESRWEALGWKASWLGNNLGTAVKTCCTPARRP